MNYKEAKAIHEINCYERFNIDPLFLFLNQFMKSGNKELQKGFLQHINFTPTSKKAAAKFEEVYNYVQQSNLLDSIIDFMLSKRETANWYSDIETEQLIQELATLDLMQDEFSPTNSIDKQLFSKVQKSNSIMDVENIVVSMSDMLKKKIYWTYYNTQTTRIIEDIFNRHERVTPTLVDIKGVDFFIGKTPLDLKITRIPEDFTEDFDKLELIKWLYENQSEQRFGAENRLFLILNDRNNPKNSDKLKITQYPRIRTEINSYLNAFNDNNLQNVSFTFAGKNYIVKSDLIFINV